MGAHLQRKRLKKKKGENDKKWRPGKKKLRPKLANMWPGEACVQKGGKTATDKF